jgi:hypothetical protein
MSVFFEQGLNMLGCGEIIRELAFKAGWWSDGAKADEPGC